MNLLLPCVRLVSSRCVVAGLSLLALIMAAQPALQAQNSEALQLHAVVPGYQRFRESQLSEIAAGRLLISELNCQSCHGAILADSLPQRQAPILTDAGNRISPDWLQKYLTDPQAAKPGTAMPHLLHTAEKAKHVQALTHFLASGGTLTPSPVSAGSVQRGANLFHQVGCAACHGDQRLPADQRPNFVMPLGVLDNKYTVNSLAAFVSNPHAVRPSGRMPALNLTDEEARDIANYLLQNIKVPATIAFSVYDGSWDKLPDFAQLKPVSTGESATFDVRVTEKRNRFALRFTTFLQIPAEGEWRFWLGSDDGSRLLIDGQEVVNADGIHPHNTIEGRMQLTAGAHSVVLEYFEQAGEESLSVEIAGPEVARQPLAGMVTKTAEPEEKPDAFQVDPQLAAVGQTLFATIGCASCHQHTAVQNAASRISSPPKFARLNLTAGCLAEQTGAGIPRFALSAQQRSDIAAAITELRKPQQPEADTKSQIATTLLTLNCYACHQRDGRGGVPRAHDHLFVGTIPEMGDEGRIPPHLDGAGDKLNAEWINHILQKGAKDRPYMTTRMPMFGDRNVGALVKQLAEHDQLQQVAEVQFSEPNHRVIADARFMVGDQALSCIKCHTFGPHKATGIQSLDLTTMNQRLRRDWFHRYLLNPQAFRAGTRMPSAWPNNRSVVPKILHGDPAQQIEAIWLYLQDGSKAKIPAGLIASAIELKPVERPVIYRNFIEGLTARGIAVGFPEKAHYAWDAEHMNLRLIWHGAFIDASKHWVGRGPGNQVPLGDHVMSFTAGPLLANLEAADQAWPTQMAREAGYQFKGYHLNPAGQPAFHYTWNDVSVTDQTLPLAVEGVPDTALTRTLEIQQTGQSANSNGDLYVRIAATDSIQQQADGWLLDNAIMLKFRSGTPQHRQIEGRHELLLQTAPDAQGKSSITYDIIW